MVELPSTHVQVFLEGMLQKVDFVNKYCQITLHGCTNLPSHHDQPCLRMPSPQPPVSLDMNMCLNTNEIEGLFIDIMLATCFPLL